MIENEKTVHQRLRLIEILFIEKERHNYRKKREDRFKEIFVIKTGGLLGWGIKQSFRNEGVKREIQEQHKKRIR